MAQPNFFKNTPSTKQDEIHTQLNSINVKDVKDGMIKLIGMISKGKDASAFFPQAVKNVVTPNLEVKKLVYMYLMHYAESKPDEVLLSINTIQNDLRDRSHFVRALALRTLCSIKVPIIAQILLMSVKSCMNDMSPYVKKAVALALPKIYSLDHETKDELKEILVRLLNDDKTSVLGAAMCSFNELCPDSWDLLHTHYRRICKTLVDCDEWAQVIIINVLLRYARAHFLSPFVEGQGLKKRKFYSSDEEEEGDNAKANYDDIYSEIDLDPDHRLLLRSCLPLLRSRNFAVVLAVCSLYYHLAPESETTNVCKSLLKIIRSNRENQYIALSNIATMCNQRPDMFRPFLKDFFVKDNDPTFIRELKLEIISHLASDLNIMSIMKEFKTYVKHNDKEFVKATIRALGRVACLVPDVAENCLNGLMSLVSSKSDIVVAETVVAIRQLLTRESEDRRTIITHLARILDNITVPVARASILWLVGEYYKEVSKIAPDILRKLAKNFVNEADMVKLQVINLGTKIYLRAKHPEKVSLLFQYVLNLAKYDQSYDLRDRARFIRKMLFEVEATADLREKAADILLANKEAPEMRSSYQDRARFCLNSLSEVVNHTTSGYQPLPDFPTTMPDPTLRQPKQPAFTSSSSSSFGKKGKTKKEANVDDLDAFYNSDSESSSYNSDTETGSQEGSSEYSTDNSNEGSASDSHSDSDSQVSGSETETDSEETGSESAENSQTESEDSEEEDTETEESSSEEEVAPPKRQVTKPTNNSKANVKANGNTNNSNKNANLLDFF